MTKHLLKKQLVRFLAVLVVLYMILLIPEPVDRDIQQASEKPFTWNKDDLWEQLEQTFRQSKDEESAVVDSKIADLSRIAEARFRRLRGKDLSPGDSELLALEGNFFSLAPLVAVQKKHAEWFINYYNQVRTMVKTKSRNWDMNSVQTRNTIYEILYGMRAAVEEVLLQSDSMDFNPALFVTDEPSSTPFTNILGITVHSGDLLVSRGGAEVSALISRGNDYPGNFSHVALIYIAEQGATPWLIEAHIEKGVAVSTVEQYIKDQKLRFMVLRPRADLPEMVKDPLLPQKAAEEMYREALARHIPYDFKMNFTDSSAMFCSEVGSHAYQAFGIRLWQGVSTISSQGVVNWLHTFGVENFVTQMPSDLEYDPQLSVVAEWRDPETLFKDHIDNAVTDIMLEGANKGEEIDYTIWELPMVRVLKAYCMVLNVFGKPGLIPEGMSATQALKNNSYVGGHVLIKRRTEELVARFIAENGYKPPYWQLVKLAREGKDPVTRAQ